MRSEPASYVGRFAPSPTGALHFGSLLAAVASYLQAKSLGGRWLLRIEDIDPPREQPGADSLIIDTLAAFGFEWDEPVSYQSQFTARHETLVEQLIATGAAYPCSCSRRDLSDAPRGPLGVIYPGTCRTGCLSGETAIRLRTHNEPIEFIDAAQGLQSQRLESESGDFIIKRRDGLIAYHLAVVADDFDQGITEIVRGIDLMDSTPRQIHLQQRLGMTTPQYLHIPVAINDRDQKLSKLTGAQPLSGDGTGETLLSALRALHQHPPETLTGENAERIWQWTIAHWDVTPLRGVESVPARPYGYG
ncbi:MAG: tRNA glutamyl-Q(34) synthetase GluQRS [Woeseiaceae bacterium]